MAKLRGLGSIGVSVLNEAPQGVCRRLADKTGDRFAGVRWPSHDSSAVFIDEALAWFEYRPLQEIPAGDHTLVLFEVAGVWCEPHGA